jgi:hypothetical protein
MSDPMAECGDTIPHQRTTSGQSAGDASRQRSEASKQDVQTGKPCKRPGGTRPRNSQARALEYYYSKDHICSALVAFVPLQLFGRNIYRNQLVFGFGGSATWATYLLANSMDDLLKGHAVLVYETPVSAVDGHGQAFTEILSWSINGMMVTEEWWCVCSLASGINATGYNTSD